jgi:hypothetical protein
LCLGIVPGLKLIQLENSSHSLGLTGEFGEKYESGRDFVPHPEMKKKGLVLVSIVHI